MTRQRLTRVAAASLTAGMAVGLGLLAAPAHAAPGVDIGHSAVDGDGTASVLVDVALPGTETPDLDSVAVTVDGHSVDATAEAVEAGQVSRTTVLALDASNSMSGDRIRQARAAAHAFLDGAPPDVKVGLLTFSKTVDDVVSPTTDRAAIAAAIDGIDLARGTHVYDAVAQAVNLAGDEGARDVLLLSDGRDTGSKSSLDESVSAAAEAGASVDVVALDQAADDEKLVAQLAHESGGKLLEADDPAALRGVFRAEADALAHQVLVSFTRPDTSSNDVELEVSLAAGGESYSDSAYVSLERVADSGPEAVPAKKPLVGTGALLAGAGGLGLGLAVLLAIVFLGGGRQTEAQRRVATYLGETKAQATPAGVKESAVALADKVVTKDFETKLSLKLNAAGFAFTAAEWILVWAGSAVAGAVLGFAFGGGPLLVLGLVLGAALPPLFLKLKRSRRLRAFSAQLPETLGLMAGGLSAGLSLSQAVDTVVQEGRAPMADELRRSLVEHRLGIPVEDALESVADRMESEDFRWVVMATRIQREVGGNLAEILNTVAETLREREYLRRQVKSLSAEGRLSAYMLGGLPPVMFTYMLFANREYVSVLYSTPIGWAMLAAGAVMLSLGGWFMFRLVKVEV